MKLRPLNNSNSEFVQTEQCILDTFKHKVHFCIQLYIYLLFDMHFMYNISGKTGCVWFSTKEGDVKSVCQV